VTKHDHMQRIILLLLLFIPKSTWKRRRHAAFRACVEMQYLAAHPHVLQSALCIIDGIDARRIWEGGWLPVASSHRLRIW
jgi:hypothetical protein